MVMSFGSIVIFSLGPSMKVLSPELIFPLSASTCVGLLYQFFTKLNFWKQ